MGFNCLMVLLREKRIFEVSKNVSRFYIIVSKFLFLLARGVGGKRISIILRKEGGVVEFFWRGS